MKLIEITEDAVKLGTFAGIRLHEKTEEAILHHIRKHKIINATPKEDIHVTLLYSKKHLPNYKPLGSIDEMAVPNRFEIFKSTPDDGTKSKNCLVLLLDSSYLHKRYSKLMKEHKATSDFKTYNPHITFSYDVGDIDTNDVPKFTETIHLIKEYKEALH